MSYQEPNQPFGPPQQQPGQQPQAQPGPQGQPEWGQQQPPQGSWGTPQGSWGQPDAAQQNPGQNSGQGWGQDWGSAQGQIPQQPHYASAPGYAQPGQTGQPQDYPPQQQYGQPTQQYGNPQPGYGPPQGYPGQPGYLPQTDFGSGAGYQPGYPPPNQGNSGLATAALWLGIFGGWGLINLIIAIFAIRETGPGKKLGRNKATTGLILTIAWAVVWGGIFFAVSDHAKNDVVSTTLPTTVSTGTAVSVSGAGSASTAPTSAATSGNVQVNTASNDPGCQAVKAAYDAFTADPGASDAVSTYISALQAAAAASQVASSQITAMVTDLQQVEQTGQEPSTATSDAQALESACDITLSTSGAN